MEGKEVRYGIADSGLWAAVTTVTSCGAVNAAFESLTGIGGLVPFANLSASETIFGGVGTGLYSMLLFVILAVFIGGLMVGRTPEFLGKKIEAREIKAAVLPVAPVGDRLRPVRHVLLQPRPQPGIGAWSIAHSRSSPERPRRRENR
jgi:K+-transporting ATPase A subunit